MLNIETNYRLKSAHSLALETGRYKKTWLPKEERRHQQCEGTSVETELHLLTFPRTEICPATLLHEIHEKKNISS